MTSKDDSHELLKILHAHRRTLRGLLLQRAMHTRAYEPPSVTNGIQEARVEIRRFKARLRDLPVTVEDALEDDEASEQHIVTEAQRKKMRRDSGIELLDSDVFNHYFPTAQIKAIVESIHTQPGYHLVEAEATVGKTALIRHIWKSQDATRPYALHIFSGRYTTKSIQKALGGLVDQLLPLVDSVRKDSYQDQDAAETLFNLLQIVAGQDQRLIILIDGVDEADIGDRKTSALQLLPDLEIVERYNMTTIVVTTRLSANENILKYLPPGHSIHRAHTYKLERFTQDETYEFLTEETQLPKNRAIAERVFDLSAGYPIIVRELYEITALHGGDISALNGRPKTQNIERYWKDMLRQMEQMASGDSVQVRRLIALMAAAKSGIRLNEIADLLKVERPNVSEILDKLSSYFPLIEGEYVLVNKHFRDYVATDEEYKLEVEQANQLLFAWVQGYVQRGDPAAAPLYVLRHAVEYLAESAGLRQLFLKPGWFDELQRRARARTVSKEAILGAWTTAEQAMENTIDTSWRFGILVANVIACALMHTSFAETLAPEVVLKLVALGLWERDEALDYSSLGFEADRGAVIAGLDTKQSQEVQSHQAEAAEWQKELLLIQRIKGLARVRALAEWFRKTRQAAFSAERAASQARALQVLASLGQPVVAPDQTEDFLSLYERLQQYVPPPTGEISDEYFDLLTSLQEAWQALPQQLGYYYFSPILRLIARTSRASLLEALDIFAPALAAVFPLPAVEQIRHTIDELADTYL